MEYIFSKLTLKFYSLLDGIYTIVPIDDSKEEYNNMMLSGNIIEVENIEAELVAEKIKRAIAIDLEYTKKISDLMIKHNDKLLESLYNDTVYVIPKSALDAKQALKDECNAKIAELGITDFSYRQSVPKLAKII